MTPMTTNSEASPGNTPLELEHFVIVDNLIQARATDIIQTPLFCFSKTERGITDYEGFTGKDIDRFVNHAAKYYLEHGLQSMRSTI